MDACYYNLRALILDTIFAENSKNFALLNIVMSLSLSLPFFVLVIKFYSGCIMIYQPPYLQLKVSIEMIVYFLGIIMYIRY